MTTSGTSAWNPVATQIITEAYRSIGALNEHESPTSGMYDAGLFRLNNLAKSWMASGFHLWAEEEGIVFLQPGQSRYLIGGTTTDNATDANSYVLTTITASAVLGSLTITVDDTTGIVDAYYIGVVLDDGTTQWTTVDDAPVGSVVALDAALTDSASAGNYVFVYATKIVRPLRIPRARRLMFNGLLENSMNVFSRKEYFNLPNKASAGMPNIFFYDPKLVSGQLYVWPVPNDSSSACRITWYRPLQDFNDPNDTADFPQEWINALIWNLGAQLAPTFNTPPPQYAMVKANAEESLELAQGWDREPEPIYFTMGYDEAQR